MNPAHLEDSDLKQGLAALFEKHACGLAGAIRGILGKNAEVGEVIQESFLRCWRARSRGTSARDPVAWMFVVTMNTSRDLRRREGRRRPAMNLEDINPMQLSVSSNPEENLERAEAVTAARAEIEHLNDKHKEVFLLRVSGGLSFDAIAEALDIPTGTAKTRMRSALQQLRRRLSAHAPTLYPETGEQA